VGAIGSVLQFSLSSSVLFDFNKFELKVEAKKELAGIAEEIKKYPGATIIISGHTDSIGTAGKIRSCRESEPRLCPISSNQRDWKNFGSKFMATGKVVPSPATRQRKTGRRIGALKSSSCRTELRQPDRSFFPCVFSKVDCRGPSLSLSDGGSRGSRAVVQRRLRACGAEPIGPAASSVPPNQLHYPPPDGCRLDDTEPRSQTTDVDGFA